jgi:hypothetical protein
MSKPVKPGRSGKLAKSCQRRANRHRGEIEAVIDGKRRILVLTLGGLAELETAFGVTDLTALADRFESGRISSRDAMTILATGLRGGELDVSPDDVARMRPEGGAGAWVTILAALLNATFVTEQAVASATHLDTEAGRGPSENPL